MVRRIALALLLVAVSAAGAEPRPDFVALPGHVAGAVLSEQVLASDSVRRQLDSGLTTVFIVAARSREARGGARLEIRYDMWDEVWVVRRIEFDGKSDRQRLPSRDALLKWWRAPVRLFAPTEDHVPIDLQLTVLPFSAAEEEDARSWISKSGGVPAQAHGANSLIDALIGSTLSARPIISYRWKGELEFR